MKKILIALAFLTLPLASHAQDAIYLSGLLGLTDVSVSDSDVDFDAELSYGLRAGLLFNDHVSAGLYLHQSSIESSSAFAKSTFDFTNIMAEVTYYFGEVDENTFWLSGLLGITQSSSSIGTINNDDSDTAYGFSAGYHFMVAPNWSLSPQFTYIHTDGNESSFAQMSGLVNVTLWL